MYTSEKQINIIITDTVRSCRYSRSENVYAGPDGRFSLAISTAIPDRRMHVPAAMPDFMYVFHPLFLIYLTSRTSKHRMTTAMPELESRSLTVSVRLYAVRSEKSRVMAALANIMRMMTTASRMMCFFEIPSAVRAVGGVAR